MSAELQADLDAFIVGDADMVDDDTDIPPPEDPEGADRLLRAVRGYEAKIEETNRIAESNVEQMLAWRDTKTYTLRGRIDRIVRSLEVWMRHRHDTSGGKVKTEKLPNGDLMVRVRSRSLHVTDEPAAVAWAAAYAAELIRFKFEIDKSLARDMIAIGPNAVDGPSDPGDGYEWRGAYTQEGERIPGLLVLEPADLSSPKYLPKFDYKTTKRGATP